MKRIKMKLEGMNPIMKVFAFPIYFAVYCCGFAIGFCIGYVKEIRKGIYTF